MVGSNPIPNRFASLRLLQLRGMVLIGLLIAQFVIGMTLDLFAKLPDTHPGTSGGYLSRSLRGYAWAITNGSGIALTLHTVIATALLLGGIAALGFSIAARHKAWIVASSFGLLGVLLAFLNGLEFINANLDKHSMAMAVSFMIAFVAYGAGLYVAKRPG